MAHLPSLSSLPHRATGVPCNHGNARAEWLAATGKSSPTSRSWKGFKARDKRRLVHQVAQRAQTAEQDYFTPYLKSDIDDIMEQGQWSVEHVVPRSKCQAAQGDAWNFVEANRSENSARSNLPPKLWPDDPNQLQTSKFQTWEGERHYAPPADERARLARKWLYTRATYACTAMSRAQRTHLPEIIALAKHTPPSPTERGAPARPEAPPGTGPRPGRPPGVVFFFETPHANTHYYSEL